MRWELEVEGDLDLDLDASPGGLADPDSVVVQYVVPKAWSD